MLSKGKLGPWEFMKSYSQILIIAFKRLSTCSDLASLSKAVKPMPNGVSWASGIQDAGYNQ